MLEEPDRATSMVLQARNREYWQRKASGFEAFHAARWPEPESAGILWDENGTIHLYGDGRKIHEAGELAYARHRVATFLAKPGRVEFSAVTPSTQQSQNLWPDDSACIKFADQTVAALQAENIGVDPMRTPSRTGYLVIYGLGLGFHIRPLLEKFRPEVLVLVESKAESVWRTGFTFDWQALQADCEAQGILLRQVIEPTSRAIVAKLAEIFRTEGLPGLDGMVSYLHDERDPYLNIAIHDFQNPLLANQAVNLGSFDRECQVLKKTYANLQEGQRRLLRPATVRCQLPVFVVGDQPLPEGFAEWLGPHRDQMVLISAGEGLAALLDLSVTPDFHCDNARTTGLYDRLADEGKQAALKSVIGVLSTAVEPGLDRHFGEAVYFLPPESCAVGVFCDQADQLLSAAGPQDWQAALAFAAHLGAGQVYLMAVQPGEFKIKRPRGNLSKYIDTGLPFLRERETLPDIISKISKAHGRVFLVEAGFTADDAESRRLYKIKLRQSTVDRADHVRDLAMQFPVYGRGSFVAAWRSARVRENVAHVMAPVIATLERADAWNLDLCGRLGRPSLDLFKQLRDQYAPRLLRGTIQRLLMVTHSVILCLKNPAQQAEAFACMKPLLLEQLHSLEMQCYVLADELEDCDPVFAARRD